MGQSRTSSIIKFLPRLLTEQTSTALASQQPYSQRFHSAAMMADITGFTALTEHYGKAGTQGVEKFTHILNDYFGHLVRIVAANGGDVVKFAGDAVLVIWRCNENQQVNACLQALNCAKQIQSELRHYQVRGENLLRLRIGVGVGQVVAAFLGGVYGRWEFSVAGPALLQVGAAAAAAKPGEVALSAEADELLQPHPDHSSKDILADNHNFGFTQLENKKNLEVTPEVVKLLTGFLPRLVIQCIDANQLDWLGELRRVTIVFINLPDWSDSTPLDHAQKITRQIQSALYRYEGSLNKLSVDDKGMTFIGGFGLPPLHHEDDATRGIRSALDIRQALLADNTQSAIGVTTGIVYCGAVGGEARREYTVMGSPVNLAARLMMEAGEGILVDAATYAAAAGHHNFAGPHTLTLKGLGQLDAWSVKEGLAATVNSAQDVRVVGRESERGQLLCQLTELAQLQSSITVVEGEAGIGKSSVLLGFAESAREAGVMLLTSAANAIEKSTPYHAWQPLLRHLLDNHFNHKAPLKEPVADMAASYRHRLQVALAEELEQIDLLPLLNNILPLGYAETKLTSQLEGEARALSTRGLLVQLIERAVAGEPAVMIIDDLQWMDSASWALTLDLSRQIKPLMLVLGTRPLDPVPAELALLLAHGQKISLQRMPSTDIVELAASCLGVASLPEEVAKVILKRAEGHPFFAEEIAYALRDGGQIEINNGQCRVVNKLSTANLPDTIRGMINTRIDKLNARPQLTLKVASVLGRVFDVEALSGIHPVATGLGDINQDLQTLTDADLTSVDSPEPKPAHIFKHVITQEVAYSLMLSQQRQDLHKLTAQWYERSQGNDLALFFPVLAHHWSRAGAAVQALYYLEAAAERALHNHANHEVIQFVEAALDIAQINTTTAADNDSSQIDAKQAVETALSDDLQQQNQAIEIELMRLSHWQSLLGQAKRGLGSYVAAEAHIIKGLAYAGQPIPTSVLGQLSGIVGQICRQSFHFLRRPAEVSETESEQLLRSAHMLERVFLIYFFGGSVLPMLYSTIAAVNLAERVGYANTVLARAYATLEVVLCSIGLLPLARYYGDKAERIAQQIDHLSTTSWVLLARSVIPSGLAQWSLAEARLYKAAKIADHTGDGRIWCEIVATLGTIKGIKGEFQASNEIYQQVWTNSERRGDYQSQGWAVLGEARNQLALKQYQRLDALMKIADSVFKGGGEDIDTYLHFDYHTICANRELARHNDDQARENITWVVNLLNSEAVPNRWIVGQASGYFADAAVELWSRNPSDKGDTKAMKCAVRELRRSAKILARCQPRLLWIEGKILSIKDKPELAIKKWRLCIQQSQALSTGYEEVLCCYALAAAQVEDSEALQQRAQMLEKAWQISTVEDLKSTGQADPLLYR